MTIVLVRHGETALNAARIVQPAATPLGARGRLQAAALAARIARAGDAAAIVSSDLQRAMQTATAIAEATGLAVEPSALLQERNFGTLRGRAYDSLPPGLLAMREAPPQGESEAEFELRIGRAWELAVERRKALRGSLIVVTHGLVVRAILARHALLSDDAGVPSHVANASMTALEAEPPYRVLAVNETAHLDGIAPDDPSAPSGG